jgi:hypothetical protein
MGGAVFLGRVAHGQPFSLGAERGGLPGSDLNRRRQRAPNNVS